MRPFIPPGLFAAIKVFSRSASFLAPGRLLRGRRWNYRIVHPVIGDGTHTAAVFKADMLPLDNTVSVQSALIKVAARSEKRPMAKLLRELWAYGLPGVNSAECFRKMHETLDETTVAFEWLDTTLADIKYTPDMRTYSLVAHVLRAALSSCVILEGHRYVNTDIKPSNILLSGVRSGNIAAKVGDLGLVIPTGLTYDVQPYAMRAPEILLQQPCVAASQVWAIAAMLLCWVKPGVLGNSKSPLPWLDELWCMAKIKRLFPHWDLPNPEEVDGWNLMLKAKSLQHIFYPTSGSLPPYLPLSFDEETAQVEMPAQLKQLLRFMLVPNPVDRPSASAVLASRELQEFEGLVRV